MANDNRMTHILLIGLAIVILLILVSHYQNKTSSSPVVYQEKELFTAEPDASIAEKQQKIEEVQPSEGPNSDVYKPVSYKNTKSVSECSPKDKLSVEDLLPKDAANSKWAQVNPAGQGDVDNQNYLTAGYHVGMNTVGPSLRNANMQLRSDPPIERMNVGPWNQSTIEYDGSRKFFEIGGDC